MRVARRRGHDDKTEMSFEMGVLFVVAIVTLLAGLDNTSGVRSSAFEEGFQVSCFPGCRCNRTVVECHNLGETTTELFRHIRPEIYPELDTLIVTGCDFGVLPNENIFGNNVRHTRLTLVNISANKMQSFGAQTFIGMPRVEYLYLDNNQLDDVVDDQPFNYLTSLKLLSMRSMFGNHISVRARADLLRRILHSNHSFVDLKEIILDNNRLDKLHEDTFCDVKGLMQLHLAHNEMSEFNFRAGCLDELHMLDLSTNRLASVSSHLWKGLRSLDTIDVSRNPLVCDCQMEAFHQFAVEEINTFLNQEATTCVAPPQLAGKQLFTLPDDANLCRHAGSFGRWLFLILIAAGLLVAYRYWRANLSMFGRLELRRKCSDASRSMRTPLVPDGYSQLKSTDDAFTSVGSGVRDSSMLPPPAFV